MKRSKSKQRGERFADVEQLTQRIAVESPESGDYLYDYKLEEAKLAETSTDTSQFHKKYKLNFSDLPISSQTLAGLQQRGFTKMTEIQRCVLPHAFAGRDILAASRTGSGKTLAYLVPLVEKLYRNKFIPLDGLGAIVLVPVRELAMQVFEVLNSFTRAMDLSVGLVIGGKDVQYEKERIQNINVLVCTPGRLLQHLQETYGFETSNLQMLVLDEADEMLQLGFRQTLEAILRGLPPRQTMLFSATLNKPLSSLAGLSLNHPERIFLHTVTSKEDGNTVQTNLANIYETPLKLTQYYMVVPAQNKLNTLYSFVKQHPKKKILVFLSTCKQVRFVYQSFKTFKFGCPLYELQGRQKQTKRMAIFYTFCEKQYGVLFCTNIASRGLDFPRVDWVVQMDIPEDVETYVHRVGRTARFRSEGRALTLVLPSEEKFIEALKSKKITINKINQNPQKLYTIDSSLEARCSQNQELKYIAQRAIISYLKFLFKASNKQVFDVRKIDVAALAHSWGLSNPPVLNFKHKANHEKSPDESEEEQKQTTGLTKIEKLRLKMKNKKLQKQGRLLQTAPKADEDNLQKQPFVTEQEDDQDILKLKGRHVPTTTKLVPTLSKRQLKKIKPDGHFEGRNKILFDEMGNPTTESDKTRLAFEANRAKNIDASDLLRQRMETNREEDMETEKERRRQRRLKRKLREQEERQAQLSREGAGLQLQLSDEEED